MESLGWSEKAKKLKEAINKHLWNDASGMYKFYLDEDDILRAVLDLESDELYKTMSAREVPGLWQDVYHKSYNGHLLYIKLQISNSAIVISFKEK